MSLQTGDWRGRRCFVIGGGPSLNSVDLGLLRDELTIGCNVAWSLDPAPTATLVFDRRVMDDFEDDTEWHVYGGAKYYMDSHVNDAKYATYTGAQALRPMSGWSRHIHDGVIRKSNCGISAINLADILGASPIYLLGFDMKPEGRLTTNWHDDYPEDWKSSAEHSYALFLRDFEKVATEIRGKVINCNLKSGLNLFPKASFEDVMAGISRAPVRRTEIAP